MTTPTPREDMFPQETRKALESERSAELASHRKLVSDLAAREAELASVKAENSKLRSALEIVHFKREPWQ